MYQLMRLTESPTEVKLRGNQKYPFHYMEVGDCFIFEGGLRDRHNVRIAAYRATHDYQTKFAVHSLEPGKWIVWRLA